MLKSYSEYYSKRFKYSQPLEQEQQQQQQSANLNASISSLDDSNQQSSADDSSSLDVAVANNSTPFGSLTNKLNTKQLAANFAGSYPGLAAAAAAAGLHHSHHNYYSPSNATNNYSNDANSYSNFQFGASCGAASNGGGFNFNQQGQLGHQPYNSMASVQNSQFYTGSHMSHNPALQMNRLGTGNGHRNSTGSTSADSSSSASTTLNSPCVDENSPVNLTNQAMARYPAVTGSYNNPLSDQQQLNMPALGADSLALPATPIVNPSTLLRIKNTNNSDACGSLPIKKRRPVPVENKDNQYWEKRRKNNESAKRSRDLKRNKEEHVSMRIMYLEQENLQLKTERVLLKEELEKLRSLLYGTNPQSNGTVPQTNVQ